MKSIKMIAKFVREAEAAKVCEVWPGVTNPTVWVVTSSSEDRSMVSRMLAHELDMSEQSLLRGNGKPAVAVVTVDGAARTYRGRTAVAAFILCSSTSEADATTIEVLERTLLAARSAAAKREFPEHFGALVRHRDDDLSRRQGALLVRLAVAGTYASTSVVTPAEVARVQAWFAETYGVRPNLVALSHDALAAVIRDMAAWGPLLRPAPDRVPGILGFLGSSKLVSDDYLPAELRALDQPGELAVVAYSDQQ